MTAPWFSLEIYRGLCSLANSSKVWSDMIKGALDEIHSGKLWVTAQMLLALQPSDKIVIASHFTKTLDLLQTLCIKLNMKVHRIDGSTSSTVRMKTVEEFNMCKIKKKINPEVLLLSCKAGGEGLNLVGASKILLYDLDWNPATDAQTLARVWRDGQKNRVSVYRLVTSGTVEESLLQRQVSKQQISSSCVDRVRKSSNITSFSAQELKDIFTLHTDSVNFHGCWTHELLDCDCQKPTVNISPDMKLLTPPRLVNPLCQLGLSRTPQRLNSSNSIAQLSSWTHWINKGQIDNCCTDRLVLNSTEQLSCVFQRTVGIEDCAKEEI